MYSCNNKACRFVRPERCRSYGVIVLVPWRRLWYSNSRGLCCNRAPCYNSFTEEKAMGQICNRCFTEKPLTEEFFFKHPTNKIGFLYQCKVCTSASTKKYREDNAEVVLEKKKNQWLKFNFKRTSEWYTKTLAEQDGHCALCPYIPTDRRLQVDHDHKCCPTPRGGNRQTCGECIRGLLCENCNTDLGRLEGWLEQIQGTVVPLAGTWLYRAVKYLEAYAWQNAK